jgi:glutamate synthase domain-containing protein 1
MSEKTSYKQNVSYLSDKESLMEVGNFTQKMANYMKIWNIDENIDSRCFSQNICHEGTDVFSCSHDDSLNEEDTALVGKEHDTVKLKHIISIY